MVQTFFAGHATQKVTPPMGINIPGYFNQRFSDGVRTDLFLNALALSDGVKKAIIFSCDAVGITPDAYALIRDRIAERCGIEPDSIYIHATHTHTSFRITKATKAITDDSIFLNHLYHCFCDVAQFAFEDLRPVSDVRIAKSEVRDVGYVRRYRMKDGTCKTNPAIGDPNIAGFDGEQDNTLHLIRFLREDAPEILLVNFGTHPDVIGGTKYCADWPGYLKDILVNAFRSKVRVLFLNACEGDSNHINAFMPKGTPRKGVDISMRMARRISGEVLKIYDDAKTVPYGHLHYSNKIVEVGQNPHDPADEEEALEIQRIYKEVKTNADPIFKKFKLNVPEALRIVKNMNGPKTFRLQISALQIGNIALIGFPGEPFMEIGRQVKAASSMDVTICTCCTNGGNGYYPTATAFAEKGYERSASPYAHNVAELLINGAKDLLGEMTRVENDNNQ